MHDSGDTAHYTLNYLDLTVKGHLRSKIMRSTEIPYILCDLLYVFHVNMVNSGHDMHHSEDTAH